MVEAISVIAKRLGGIPAECRPGKTVEEDACVPWSILFVHEDPCTLKSVGSVLLEKGFHVAARKSLSAALDLLESTGFDLMLAGLGEDSARGLLMLRAAREMRPQMKIIVFTSGPDDIPKVNLSAVADDFISRPTSSPEILDQLSRWLKSRRLSGEDLRDPRNVRVINQELLNLLMVMSHDLRGGLLALGAGMNLLGRGVFGPMDPDAAQKTADLYARLKSLTGITEDFLGKAYSLTEEIELQRETVDLFLEILRPVVEEISLEARDRVLGIEIHPPIEHGRRLPVLADRVWLKTVFRNLLRNAVRHGQQGTTVRIGVKVKESKYKINVYNSGQPIPENFQSRLFARFARFSRGGRTTTGVGMGLYLIREIVQKHGGKIWYEPRENGSNFVFTLPRK